MQAVRKIVRTPMSVFDQYRSLCFTSPRLMNFYMLYASFFFALFLGKGYEKIVFQGKHVEHERDRRFRRFFIPYSLVSYKWRFPVNQ
ncbi:UNKNOWN [Stylonychia lemnae]|uniref:Uncharacterized protein n=1 Tax=Stylonychia lemnae TaxID=5949 RepID=A0A078AX16_STYLE|nr:UNKNOWN [Stylonychia lemnae]|eukprot:CDW85797.1 UNKNOWN [Stylonychia lemnae]